MMNKLDNVYMNKLYGGFLGKLIGVIHGAEVEGWTCEKIKRVYGTITEYPVKFKNFCSDDDVNGPLFYMRALEDFPCSPDIPEEQMAHTLLNYVGERHGFFWWGGYGVSTEETAYWNLVDGIPAPLSGSSEQNGKTVAEQIGGQIFSDCWGLLCPGDTKTAAMLAGKMSGVTHGGNSVWGGMFIAACIAAAFGENTPEAVILKALEVIPADCAYAGMVRDVMNESKKHEDFRDTFRFVQGKYGYDKYDGVCHIIPNAAVIILSLMHGRGDFSDTLNICNMCGWDTDCNVGNTGSILGVMTGASRIPRQWLGQVNDFIAASSVVGCLNIQTVSQEALLAAKLTSRLYPGDRGPEGIWKRLFEEPEGKHFHFEFPTATHAMRISGNEQGKIRMENTAETAYSGERSLKLTAAYLAAGEAFRLYHKTYYVPEDFNDSRYDPDFSPTVYPGDRISVMVRCKNPSQIMHVTPFYKDRISQEIHLLEGQAERGLTGSSWFKVEFQIPPGENVIVEEIGWEFTAAALEDIFEVYVDDVIFEASPSYKMDFSALPLEKWNNVHTCPAHITWLRGIVGLEENNLAVSGGIRPSEAYTGDLSWRDYCFTTVLRPKRGGVHRVLFRVQGGMRCYGAGFSEGGRLCLWKKDGKYRLLKEVPYDWQQDGSYEIEICVRGNRIFVAVGGVRCLWFEDASKPYLHGCVGFGNENMSRTWYKRYSVEKFLAD